MVDEIFGYRSPEHDVIALGAPEKKLHLRTTMEEKPGRDLEETSHVPVP